MKYLFFLVLLAFPALPAFGQKNLTEVDLKVNGVGSGAPYSDVLKKLGNPKRSFENKFSADKACSNRAETHLTLVYTGLKVVLLGDKKGRNATVYSIEVTSPDWLLDSGLKIGADIQSVKEKFGTTEELSESTQTVLTYVTKDNLGTVNFYFQNDRLVKVEMTETLC